MRHKVSVDPVNDASLAGFPSHNDSHCGEQKECQPVPASRGHKHCRHEHRADSDLPAVVHKKLLLFSVWPHPASGAQPISMTPPVVGFVLLPATNGASAENGASNHFQTSETPVHRASPHRSSCAIQRCSSVVILLATTTSPHLLPNCRQGDLLSEADHPRPPLSLPRSHFYSTVNHSLCVSPASRPQVQGRVIRPALHRQITRAKPTTSASKSLQRS